MRHPPLEFRAVDVAPPKRKKYRRRTEKVMLAIAGLKLGECLEVNRPIKTCWKYTGHFRKFFDMPYSFRVRRSVEPGWSRIWRIR